MAAGNNRANKIIDGAMYALLIILCVAMPFAIDTSLPNPFVLPKEYLMLGAAMVGSVLWIVKSILSKKIVFYRSSLNKFFLPFILAGLLSVLFSDSRLTSMLGRSDYFTLSFIFLLGGWLLFTLIQHILNSVQRWQGFLDVIVGVGAITAIIFSAKAIFDADVLSFIGKNLWSTVDYANSVVALWFVTVCLLAAGQLSKKGIPLVRQLLYFLGIVSTFMAVLALNFHSVWWLMIAGLVILIVIGIVFLAEVRMVWLVSMFSLAVFVVIMIIFGFPKISSSVPTEIVLNNSSSWIVAKGSLFSGLKNSLLGNGLGTFSLAFSHFRDVAFNTDPNAWSLRFNQSYSTFMNMLTEGGAFVIVTFFAAILYIAGLIWKGIKLARKNAGESIVQFFSDNPAATPPLYEVIALAAPWFIITAGMFLFTFGPIMWWLWWTLTAALVVGLSFTDESLFTVKEFRLNNKPEYTLSLSFISVVIVGALLVVGIGGMRVYAAETSYFKALNTNEQAEDLLIKAASYNANREQYRVALAQLYLLKATELSRAEKPDVQQIGQFVEKAVSEARRASEIAPQSVVVWENLAVMYENAAALIEEARGWALTSLEKAFELEKTNPVLAWKIGNINYQNGNYNEAIKKYEQAVALKADFSPAYASLASAYEKILDLEKSLLAYEAAVRFEPNNVDYAFNYGRILYNRNTSGDRARAEKIWKMVAEYEPKHSNTLYSLASMYESRGEKSLALTYYKRVLELNPTNKELKIKVNSLSK